MRYQLWDVLLFPEPSNIPIQEFKTACFVTHDAESNGAIPTLTTFVPSQARGSPFRVSVHAWETPKLSVNVSTSRTAGEKTLIGVRVIIDGICVACEAFEPTSDWPQILSLSNTLSAKNVTTRLKFPPFHYEILDQAHWNAGDSLGRIKVVISEGVERGQLQGRINFKPLTNLVCFSFQPAPLDVLEQSAIAWPNAGMWLAFSGSISTPQNFGIPFHSQSAPIMGPDSHAHSPRRRRFHTVASSCFPGHSFLTPQSQAVPNMPDPFVDNQSLRSTPAFYPTPVNGQPLIGGPSPQDKGVEMRLPDDQLARLIDALSPQTKNNYRASNEQAYRQMASGVDSSSLPPISSSSLFDPKFTAASGIRASAPTRLPSIGQGTTIWDSVHAFQAPDGKHGRDPTDISMHTGCTDFPNCNHDERHEPQPAADSPATQVRGKKEGSAKKEKDERVFTPTSKESPNPTNVAQPTQHNVSASGEKRKRSAIESGTSNEASPAPMEGSVKKMSLRSRSNISALLQDEGNKEST